MSGIQEIEKDKRNQFLLKKYEGMDLTLEEMEFLEKDNGGDDDEASKFKYSRTGSDIRMPPVSDDGDHAEMRHRQIEEEEAEKRRKLEEEAKKPIMAEIQI